MSPPNPFPRHVAKITDSCHRTLSEDHCRRRAGNFKSYLQCRCGCIRGVSRAGLRGVPIQGISGSRIRPREWYETAYRVSEGGLFRPRWLRPRPRCIGGICVGAPSGRCGVGASNGEATTSKGGWQAS